MIYVKQKKKSDCLDTKKVKITCTAGFSTVMDIPEYNKLEQIDNFPAYNNIHPSRGFVPECINCNDTRIFLSFVNENEDTLVVKICNFTLEDKP